MYYILEHLLDVWADFLHFRKFSRMRSMKEKVMSLHWHMFTLIIGLFAEASVSRIHLDLYFEWFILMPAHSWKPSRISSLVKFLPNPKLMISTPWHSWCEWHIAHIEQGIGGVRDSGERKDELPDKSTCSPPEDGALLTTTAKNNSGWILPLTTTRA